MPKQPETMMSPLRIPQQTKLIEEEAQGYPYYSLELPLFQPQIRQDPLGQVIEGILRKFAESGELMVLWDVFLQQIKSKLPGNQNLELLPANCLDIYHQTMRKFGDCQPTFYVSLHLTSLSIQSLLWILESIKKDKMTPSEKLIFSRVKECYGLKINQYVWAQIIHRLLSMANPQGIISFNGQLPELRMVKIKDAINNSEYYQIYMGPSMWPVEDVGQIYQHDQDKWNDFMQFLRDFFREDSRQQLQISSVINIHSYDPRKSVVKPPKSVNQAIPGGRYGCAQLLKCCGPPSLRNLSLGKLSLFVQEAITQDILIYYKTLLIKGKLDNNPSFMVHPDIVCQKQQRIKWVQFIIVDILKENMKGISLARLPKLIQKRVNFLFDIQDLGFLKLKNLLKTIPGVYIQNDGTTFAQAFYIKNYFDYDIQIAAVKNIVEGLLKERKNAIHIDELYFHVTKTLGYTLDMLALQCLKFSEFIQKYLSEYYSVSPNGIVSHNVVEPEQQQVKF